MIKKIIITSGPTKEWIDPVRYISNASSGLMGHSLAEECKKLTENIVYIAGGTDPNYKIVAEAKNIAVESTEDMLKSIIDELEENSLLIMAAAPADYRPANPSEIKIKKKDSQFKAKESLTLELIENPDILKTVSDHVQVKNWKNVKRIGFSAETHDLELNALGKLERKDLDWILGNSVGKGIGFGVVQNTLHCYARNGERIVLGPLDKRSLAKEIVDKILRNMF
ncbi:MAG: phosphopantothenoylcysteine decarboxylase [Leptospira sp.]|nr:phosphopantothenoylcysteine decarboxylase [Leptospira sp.]